MIHELFARLAGVGCLRVPIAVVRKGALAIEIEKHRIVHHGVVTLVDGAHERVSLFHTSLPPSADRPANRYSASTTRSAALGLRFRALARRGSYDQHLP